MDYIESSDKCLTFHYRILPYTALDTCRHAIMIAQWESLTILLGRCDKMDAASSHFWQCVIVVITGELAQ